MFSLDFVVIKDNRACEAGFFWGDVQQIIGVYGGDESVKVKFRRDTDETYTLIFVMPMAEFLEQVKKQLNPPPRLYSDNEVICEVPTTDDFWHKPDGAGDGV